jgi:prepilin-type processing-associated H-X9-DG protein
MTIEALDIILKSFAEPDEVRTFSKGRFELVHLGGRTFGRATYQPGWRWSVEVGPQVGKRFCDVEHLGLVISGRATVAFADGRVIVLEPGKLFQVSSKPHDSWVVGGEPYVSLHFLGAEKYAK